METTSIYFYLNSFAGGVGPSTWCPCGWHDVWRPCSRIGWFPSSLQLTAPTRTDQVGNIPLPVLWNSNRFLILCRLGGNQTTVISYDDYQVRVGLVFLFHCLKCLSLLSHLPPISYKLATVRCRNSWATPVASFIFFFNFNSDRVIMYVFISQTAN